MVAAKRIHSDTLVTYGPSSCGTGIERSRIKILEQTVGVGFAGQPTDFAFVKLFVMILNSRIAHASVFETPTSSKWKREGPGSYAGMSSRARHSVGEKN